jgi:hypothetical protein
VVSRLGEILGGRRLYYMERSGRQTTSDNAQENIKRAAGGTVSRRSVPRADTQ